ncbi:MAG: aminodeoxychorismate lyase [Marmoricola sp.]
MLGAWPGLFYAQCMVPIGEGVFETCRIADSRPEALTRHLDRLRAAAAKVGLEPPDAAEIRRRIAAHLAAEPLTYGRMRLSVVSDGESAALSIAAVPTPPTPSAVRLATSDWRVASHGPLVGLKSTDYVDYAAALRGAQERGFEEALLANTSGQVCETTTANIFFVLDGALCTPALSTGCLPGIARGVILELCDTSEVEVPLEMLAEATEVFLTSSLRAVQTVSRIDDRAYSEDGPFTTRAREAWHRSVERV